MPSRIRAVRIGYFAQEPELGAARTVREAVDEAVAETRQLVTEFEELSQKLGEPMSDDEMTKLLESQGKLQDSIDAADAWNLDSHVEIAMEALALPPADAEIETLSGGEKRRVALCRILLGRPDMLLLDEPTNHLDAESVAWLERFLKEYAGTVVAVTHDRYFLDDVAGVDPRARSRARATRSRATTRRGSSRSERASRPRKSRRARASASSSRSSSGCARRRARAKRRARRGSPPTRIWSPRATRAPPIPPRSASRPDRASATS